MIMGRKGESSGLKRKPAPRFWPIHRKEFTWVVKPSPGPHAAGKCLPLAVALRDVLGFAKTRKEAKTIVSGERVHIDGKVVREDDFPVGLMDVISLPDADKHFRVLPSYRGLILHPISSEEAGFKLCRIENKTVVSQGRIQLNLHDGSSILVKVADLKKPQEDSYRTLDTLKVSLPERQVLEHIAMRKNDYAVAIGGKNAGRNGKIIEIETGEGKKRRNALVTIEDGEGNRYQTMLSLVFALGEKQSAISMQEASQLV